ncbi:MSP domain protein [Thermoascus aurantiacus ATCC 26904]
MSIELEPSDLGFKRPFNREVCQTLHLRNPNRDPVAFKVKTTAPKHYCVRPNSGRIEPGKHVEVQVLLQAMKEEPPLDAKCKDKFLVQSVAITGDMEFQNVTSIFDKVAKSAIQERKIRVNFLPPDSPTAEQRGETNGVAPSEEEQPSLSSPAANYDTPAPATSKRPADDVSPIPAPDFGEKPKQEPSPPPSNENTTPSGGASLKSTAASVVPTSTEDFKAQLAEAHAQIQKLKSQLAEQGLRHRKTSSEDAKETAPMLQQQHPQPVEAGVPVQIVAGLCLISFLLAYFFF